MKFNIESKKLQEILDESEKQEKFSGVVHISMDDKVLFSSTHGYANRTWDVKNTIDTKFRVGSISKIFTAVAILMLAEKNKLRIEDKIHYYLELRETQISEKITIEHLLTHTSGIGDYYDEMNATDEDWFKLWECKPIYTMKNLSDYYELFKNKKPLSSPGEKFHYSGAGYILLGMLIEKLTSEKYDEYIKKEIFDKLELNDTMYLDNEILVKGVADGYEPEYDGNKVVGWMKNIFTMTPRPSADGGATSTVNDLIKFSRALRNNELLNEENTKLILEPRVLDKDSDGFRNYTWKYSFANWFLLEGDKIVRYGHTGEEFGVSARLYYFPEQDIDVIILGNQGFCTGSIGWDINDLILGKM